LWHESGGLTTPADTEHLARTLACTEEIDLGEYPDGLRHTYKTLMLELGVPAKLMDERLGHAHGSVQARYSHVTPEMRRRLLEGLTKLWSGPWRSAGP
jgi:integrase